MRSGKPGHRITVAALRPLGVTRDVVAGAGTRLPHLGKPAALRPLQADDREQPPGFIRLGELGHTQSSVNFELNVESYGRDFAHEMGKIIENKLRAAREVTLAEVDGRSYPAKLRDSIARLFSPYL